MPGPPVRIFVTRSNDRGLLVAHCDECGPLAKEREVPELPNATKVVDAARRHGREAHPDGWKVIEPPPAPPKTSSTKRAG